MDKKTVARKILLCVSSLGSAFLFFCFLGKAYGASLESPSWYDLIFGGTEKAVSNPDGPLRIAKYEPTIPGITLFAFTIASGVIGLWLFAASLTKERSNWGMSLGFTALHLILLLLGLFLCSFVVPIFVSSRSRDAIGVGSVCYIVFCAIFLLCDALGIFLLLKEKKIV